MRKYELIAVVLILAGFALLVTGVLSGEGYAGFVLFVPVLWGSGILMLAGILLIICAFFALFMSLAYHEKYFEPVLQRTCAEKRKDKRFSGVVLIGPFPVIFGTDKTTLLIAIVGAVILVVLMLIIFFVMRV